ncbi:DUF362 domain-containing protein [Fundidesulfovibrio butyratiphilus]
MPIDVFLRRVPDYDPPRIDREVAQLLDRCGFRPAPGSRVLVKPNLVAPYNPSLSCTHPSVVRATCLYLLDLDTKITVADSPAFGTAGVVAMASGMSRALAGLPVRLATLSDPKPLRLTQGGRVGVSAQALDACAVVNLARFKAHDQMLLTLAVKNLFGCVVGFRKSLAHSLHGDRGTRFASLILDVYERVRPAVSLVDGVVAMHKRGPAKGEPYPLGLLGASVCGQALDSALHAVLGLPPDASPLGRETVARRRAGADPANLLFPELAPEAFSVKGFELPTALAPQTFHPLRLIRGRLKSLYVRLRGAPGGDH